MGDDTTARATAHAAARIISTRRVFGGMELLGLAVIIVACLAVQFLRTDLDWITTPLSIYVLGRYGPWVQAGLFAPAPGLALLGFGLYGALHRQARSAVTVALFVAAAVGLCLTAAFRTDTTPSPVTTHGMIHQWAAFATFVFVTTGMVLQSWRFRRDPHWRMHFPDAFAIAIITIIYFWIYALFHPIPRGVGEKIVIALVVLWLWRVAWWLVSTAPAMPATEPTRSST